MALVKAKPRITPEDLQVLWCDAVCLGG